MLTHGDGYLLSVGQSREQLAKENKHVLKYIEYGERDQRPSRRGLRESNFDAPASLARTTQGRRLWYVLGDRPAAPILFPNLFWRRPIVYLNEIGARAINSLFEVYPSPGLDPKLLCAVLNSILTSLMLELCGRLIENQDRTRSRQLMIYELKALPTIDFAGLSRDQKERITDEFEGKLLDEAKRQGSMEFPDTERILFCEVLGFSEDQFRQVYEAYDSILNERLAPLIPLLDSKKPVYAAR